MCRLRSKRSAFRTACREIHSIGRANIERPDPFPIDAMRRRQHLGIIVVLAFGEHVERAAVQTTDHIFDPMVAISGFLDDRVQWMPSGDVA